MQQQDDAADANDCAYEQNCNGDNYFFHRSHISCTVLVFLGFWHNSLIDFSFDLRCIW